MCGLLLLVTVCLMWGFSLLILLSLKLWRTLVEHLEVNGSVEVLIVVRLAAGLLVSTCVCEKRFMLCSWVMMFVYFVQAVY